MSYHYRINPERDGLGEMWITTAVASVLVQREILPDTVDDDGWPDCVPWELIRRLINAEKRKP